MTLIPAELWEISKKVVWIALGENHMMMLFAGGELGVCGSNEYGQLGVKFWEKIWEQNFINELRIIEIPKLKDLKVIDIAAG